MADVEDVSSLSGDELTEANIRALLNRQVLNLHNMTAGKWDAVDYAEFGSTGHRKDPSKLMAECRKLIELYKGMLNELPALEIHQWDDPAI